MIYALSIDWLAFYCESDIGELLLYDEEFKYELAPHGTRQFAELVRVIRNGEEFAEVQQKPSSPILKPRTLIVKFCNRYLYSAGLWFMVNKFLDIHKLRILNVSRVDLCADFNSFAYSLRPEVLIKNFLSSHFRHIGRGKGSAYFNHDVKREGKRSRSYLNYTGLAFGTHKSDCRAYLYNKSFELMTVHDKPWIKQLWREVGLVNSFEKPVWRLEISITSKAMKFKNSETGEGMTVSHGSLQENKDIALIYFAFVRSLFSFVVNRADIKNISREPRIELFTGAPSIQRAVLKPESAGDRAERILIRQLWQMADTYRGNEVVEDEGMSKILAVNLASSCGLTEWLGRKKSEWNTPKKK